MRLAWTAPLFLLCIAQAAAESWLGVCESAESGARVLAEYIGPRGAHTLLVLGPHPIPHCTGIVLPFAPDAIVSGRLISPALATELAPGFALVGRDTEKGFEVSEVTSQAEHAAPGEIPAGVELIEGLDAIAFGVEERAIVRREQGRLTLGCTAGTAAAGMLLRFPNRGLPRGIPLTLSVRYAADGEFTWGISDAPRAANGDPLRLGSLPTGPTTATLELPRKGLDPASIESLSLACPRQAARFELNSLKIEPRDARSPPPRRALWAWQPAAWLETPAVLLDKLARAGADTVFVTVPVEEGRVVRPRTLEAFVRSARERGVRVWAVTGDPRAVMESERAAFVGRAAAYALYNRDAPPDGRLAGIQYDIEPYLNTGYALDAQDWHEAYLATLRQLRHAADLPVDIAVPFWWADQGAGSASLLERLAPVVDGVTVMDYRTDAAQIKRFAQPFLDWGARHGRAVRIALEYGPIPDEVQRHYRPAREGEVALFTVGPHCALLRFQRPSASPGAQVYALTHTTPAPGSAVTFAGRKDALLGLLPELERLWSAWPTFAGVAIHEFEP